MLKDVSNNFLVSGWKKAFENDFKLKLRRLEAVSYKKMYQKCNNLDRPFKNAFFSFAPFFT